MLNTWDALRDLVPFEEFKKREKYPWSVKFTKSNTSPWVFYTGVFYIVQIVPNRATHHIS